MAHLVHNERLKLTATFLNTIAAASATVGVIAPFSRLLLEGDSSMLTLRSGVYAATWLVLAVLVHGLARRLLKELRE